MNSEHVAPEQALKGRESAAPGRCRLFMTK
jgi:hypothetical protein